MVIAQNTLIQANFALLIYTLFVHTTASVSFEDASRFLL